MTNTLTALCLSSIILDPGGEFYGAQFVDNNDTIFYFKELRTYREQGWWRKQIPITRDSKGDDGVAATIMWNWYWQHRGVLTTIEEQAFMAPVAHR